MLTLLARYARWLHTGWPAGGVEPLPRVDEHGRTNVPRLYVVGDLAGVPLLKISADSGTRAVRHAAADPAFARLRTRGGEGVRDLAILGAGASGMAAALEARALGLDFALVEASEAWSTIANFPAQKPIYAYPSAMVPAGALRFLAKHKEPLLDELRARTSGIVPTIARAERVRRVGDLLAVDLEGADPILARGVIVALGRSGSHRRLGVDGESEATVTNRLHDPADHAGTDVLVAGGGDAAAETAIALARAGARVTLVHRGGELVRVNPALAGALAELTRQPAPPAAGSLALVLGARVRRVAPGAATLVDTNGGERTIPAALVFAMLGREPPLAFFRASGVRIRGERDGRWVATLAVALALAMLVYHWKKPEPLGIHEAFKARGWFPFGLAERLETWTWTRDTHPSSLAGVVLGAAKSDPGFYYSLAYCALVVVFGLRRIRRRRTPYVRAQTWCLMAIQLGPLFLLPYVALPWMAANGWFAPAADGSGTVLSWIDDTFFPDHSYWRAFGLILAWPLFVYNCFDAQPIWGWLVLSLVQTFVVIPLIVRRWGKGAYCGWICSCGALAETLGDRHRDKMPHGPGWNRLNLAGQGILFLAFALLGLRIASWIWPGGVLEHAFVVGFQGQSGHPVWAWCHYGYAVDLVLAGVVGVGLYFHASGRVWCRFFCPLAALMNVYARFTRFRIFPEKSKCISCNACTTACHQGIDVMAFAQRGAPMADPQCVRCSACLGACPTGVLQFGALDGAGVPRYDSLAASPALIAERA